MMDGQDATASSPSASRWHPTSTALAFGVALLAAALWWWWPSLARDPDRLDVLVVGDGEVTEASEPIARRIREEGMSVEVVALDPCANPSVVADAMGDRSPAVVVLSPSVPCADWPALVEAPRDDDRQVIALVQPGTVTADDVAALDDLDVGIADPSRLVPSEPGARVACLWWDDCEADGLVVVRSPDGRLTSAGAERVARVLTGTIP